MRTLCTFNLFQFRGKKINKRKHQQQHIFQNGFFIRLTEWRTKQIEKIKVFYNDKYALLYMHKV